jgi:hypothetical protein
VGNLKERAAQSKMWRWHKEKEVFIGHGAAQRNRNRSRLGCRAPIRMRCLGNRTWCTGFLEGQATISVSEIGYKRRDGRAAMDTCIIGSSIFLERIINPVHQRIRITQRSFSVADRLEESERVA